VRKKKIILIGGGGHCKSCIEVINSKDEFEIIGIVDKEERIGETILGYKIFATDDDIPELRLKYQYALITIGQVKSSSLREKLFNLAKKEGFCLPSIVASTAYLSKSAELGEGTILMHHTMVNSDVKIGVNTIINTKSLIEHDTVIGDFNHISTNSIINGNVTIGNSCMIGSNTVCKNGIVLGNNVIIGLGSVIHKDIKGSGTYLGNPLRKIK
tara:strand:+ start:29 stop:667 length:639 start_codon:yes stop_codon:yes gene_type:complete